MSTNQKITKKIVVEQNLQSKTLHLQYSEQGKPSATFAYNTQEEREAAERILKNSGVEI